MQRSVLQRECAIYLTMKITTQDGVIEGNTASGRLVNATSNCVPKTTALISPAL